MSIGAQPDTKSEDCNITSEDYAVYSAVVTNLGKPEDPEERWDDKPDLIIQEVTDPGKDGNSNMWGFRSPSNQRPNDDTVNHFNSRRQNSCHLKPHLNAAISYHFLPEQELNRFFKKKHTAGWTDFYKKYPKSSGFWSFSPVGYNNLVAKEYDRWIVKNRVMLWIS